MFESSTKRLLQLLSPRLTQILTQRSCQIVSGIIPQKGDATQTAFHFFRPKNAEKTLILFHGTGNDALFAWESLIAYACERQRSVLCFDLAGHGRWSQGDFQLTLGEHESKVLMQLSKHLELAQTWEFCGYSLGALLAWKLSQSQLYPVEKLVLLALPLSIKLSWKFYLQESLSLFHQDFWLHLINYGYEASVPAFGAFRRQRFPIRQDNHGALRYPELIRLCFAQELPNCLNKRTLIPSLAVFGAKDYLAPATHFPTLSQGFSNLRLDVIEGSNHFLLPMLTETHRRIFQFLA